MKILIPTYRLLRKMGNYKAWSTLEIVDMTGKQRCAVLKRLHRLEEAGVVEKRLGPDQKFYWKVKDMPNKPKSMIIWKEPKSIKEMTKEERERALEKINRKE